MSTYNTYARMSSSTKNRMADGDEFQEAMKQYNLQDGNSRTPKRQHSGGHETKENEDINVLTDNAQDSPFTVAKKQRKSSRRKVNDNKTEQDDVRQLNDDVNNLQEEKEQQHGRYVKNGKIKNTSRTFVNGNLTGMNKQVTHKPKQTRNNAKNTKKDNQTDSSINLTHTNDIDQYQNTPILDHHQKDVSNQHKAPISQQTIQYAIEQHLPPIKINCEPKVKENKDAICLIKEFFSIIEPNFRKLNPKYCKPIGFEYWFIDRDGNLSCFTREIELFVFLCDAFNYPGQVLNTTFKPITPKRLPPQCSVLFKFVSNDITIDEFKAELMVQYQSVFTIEEMRGTRTGKSRHIRLDLTDPKEYSCLLNGGSLAIAGQLIEVAEFLAPPRLLICSRCNTPGHIKKHCKIDYDRCRRCGGDRSQGDHSTCTLQCHHCNGEHEATAFKCPVINDFRHELIEQLKNRPDLLPCNVQLFIPTEFRSSRNKNNHILTNNIPNSSSQQQPQQKNFSYHSNVWPSINGKEKSTTTSSSISWTSLPTDSSTLWNEMLKTQGEFDLLKRKFECQEQLLLSKFNDHKLKMGSILSLVSVQVQQQHESINSLFSFIKEIVPMVANSLAVCQKLVTKAAVVSPDQNEKNEFELLSQQILSSITYLNDQNNHVTNKQGELIKYFEKNTQMMKQGVELLLSSNE
ncbi:unnamed protein product [Adineta steineri]|uniref:CCHC-type domain-containing protein n=1 Tax=Adineta steineri TaxID=433720 RepID=A0A818ZM49_9BILA|nr:unnamed protein product [Adineta steineri]CAF3770817.1 unnamed protein product [Adineta steineri]